MRTERTIALVFSLLTIGTTAAAQSPPSASQIAPVMTHEESDRLAREHFQLGRAAFANGDFEAAAREFQEAYNLSQRSALLYNIGTAHERLHEWAEARTAFQRYVTENPTAQDRAEVEGRLRMIESELNRQPTTRVVVVERPVLVEEGISRPFRVLFFVGAGLTAIAGGGTLAIGLLADKQYNALASTCAPHCSQTDIDDMRLRQNLVNGGIVATSVFGAATVAFYILDALRARPAPRPASPTPGAEHTGPTVSFAPLQGGGMLTLGGAL